MTVHHRSIGRLRRLAPAALGLVFIATPAGASVIRDFAPNRVLLETKLDVGFFGTGSMAADVASDRDAAVALDTSPTTAVTSNASKAPRTGATKDIAQASLTAAFAYDAPAPVDRLKFEIAGAASASAAKNTVGNESSAVVGGKAIALFFLDAAFGGVSSGDLVGSLALGDLRALDPFETALGVTVFESGTAIFTHLAGSAAALVQLRANHLYQVSFEYRMEVPFGSDPPFSSTFEILIEPLVAAPEPASVLLAGLGLLALAGVHASGRRTRGRRAGAA